MKVLIFLCVIVGMTLAHRHYTARIPNGLKVPDPCRPGSTWEGVGHFNHLGTGPRNKFGYDFQHTGHHHWTVRLCQADSDDDGKTNGQELGDPHCTWSGGDPEEPATGHPGICEPLDSPACQSHSPC